ncbi:MAG: hypothetical protein PHO01_06425 [Desulfotomaculaceae bacterium]|nr:hypothetical protein [Desulfotomaculaceae bacterium]
MTDCTVHWQGLAREKLFQAKVLVVGAGGLGAPASIYLTGKLLLLIIPGFIEKQ